MRAGRSCGRTPPGGHPHETTDAGRVHDDLAALLADDIAEDVGPVGVSAQDRPDRWARSVA